MHELGITENIISIVAEHAQGIPVKRVTLEIGQLSAILPDAIRFCFDVCARGTPLEGAQLEIQEIVGIGQCLACYQQISLNEPFGICDRCGSVQIRIIQGQELKIKEMELENLCV